MNLTELRVRALLLVQEKPGIDAQHVAYDLINRCWKPQGATRWGSGYMQPLIKAGLIRANRGLISGFARYYLTELGHQKLARMDDVASHIRDREFGALSIWRK